MKEIAAALIEAQKELPLVIGKDSKLVVGKDSSGKAVERYYSSLEAIIEKVRPILSRHGIALLQTGVVAESGQLMCYTRLIHSSGESVEGHWPVFEAKDNRLHPAQAMGQGWTYARRYSLASILGIGTGDKDIDDNEPQKAEQRQSQQPKEEEPPVHGYQMGTKQLAQWKTRVGELATELGGEYGILCSRLKCNPDEFTTTTEAQQFQREADKAKEILGL